MEPLNPYTPPEAPTTKAPKKLGSLAQSARGNELNQARNILIIIGVLTLALNGFMLYNAPNSAINGIAAALGLVFIFLGIIIKKFPLPITILSLALYLGATAAFALLNPLSLVSGIIFKVFIIIALVRAIKAARAYQEEVSHDAFGDEAL